MYSLDDQALRLAKDLLVRPAALVDVAAPLFPIHPLAFVHNLMRTSQTCIAIGCLLMLRDHFARPTCCVTAAAASRAKGSSTCRRVGKERSLCPLTGPG